MRFFVSALLIVLAGSQARGQFDLYEESRKDSPATQDDPFGMKREQKAWQAWLQSLGAGPIYRVEMLYRYQEDGRLYYLRTLISSKKPEGGGMFGMGLGDKGKPIPAPDPGNQPVREQESVTMTVSKPGEKPLVPPAPLARKTGHIGVSMRRSDSVSGRLMIRESDTATGMPLPRKGVEVGFFHGIFLVELLTPEQAAREGPLRRDPEFFKRRTAELHKLLLTTHLPRVLADDRSLETAAITLQDPSLMTEVRKRLNAWIDRTPEQARNSFPSELLDALQHNGTAGDFALFERLSKRHPDHARGLLWTTLHLARRTGGDRAMPVWATLVADRQPTDIDAPVRDLRALLPSIPEPQRGDLAVGEMVRAFKLNPADFHLKVAQNELLARADQAKLSEGVRSHYRLLQKQPYLGSWFFLNEADRARGRKAALAWLAAYRAP